MPATPAPALKGRATFNQPLTRRFGESETNHTASGNAVGKAPLLNSFTFSYETTRRPKDQGRIFFTWATRRGKSAAKTLIGLMPAPNNVMIAPK